MLAGAVRLGYRKELAVLPIGAEREALFGRLLAQLVANGMAVPMATKLEIDPADTRHWLASAPVAPMAPGRFIDTR